MSLKISAFKANGIVREPNTPTSPFEASDYLDLDNPRKANSYANLIPTSSTTAPLPPPPPPPGMCIPFEYMNITPLGASTLSTPAINLEKVVESNNSNDHQPESDLKSLSNDEIEITEKKNSEKQEDFKTSNDEERISESQKLNEDSSNVEIVQETKSEFACQQNLNDKKENDVKKEKSEEEITGDVVDGAFGEDVVDSSVHDYMNVETSSEGVQIVGIVPKKPAPPVPPRCKNTIFLINKHNRFSY